MSRTLRLCIQTLAITLLLIGASKATGDSELTIEEILADLDVSNSDLIDKLLKRKTAIFQDSGVKTESHDLAEVLVALIDGESEWDKQDPKIEVTKEDIIEAVKIELESNIVELLSDDEGVLKKASKNVLDKIDPLIHRFIFQELSKNINAGNILEVLAEIKQETETTISHNLTNVINYVEKNVEDQVSNLIGIFKFDIESIITTVIDNFFDKVFIDPLVDEKWIEDHLKIVEELYKILLKHMKNKNIEGIATLQLRTIMALNIKRAIRFDNKRFENVTARFLIAVTKDMLDDNILNVDKKCELLDIIMNAFLAFYQTEAKRRLDLSDNMHKFMTLRYFNGKNFDFNKLKTYDENKRNQLILELIHHLTHTIGHNLKNDREDVNIEQSCFMSDNDVRGLIENIEYLFNIDPLIPLRSDTTFYYLGSYIKDLDNMEVTSYDEPKYDNFELNEIFYNFWLAFVDHKKEHLMDPKDDVKNANDFLNEMKGKEQDYSKLHDFNMKENYGLIKLILMFGIKGDDDVPKFDFDQNYSSTTFVQNILKYKGTTLYDYFETLFSKIHPEISINTPEETLIEWVDRSDITALDILSSVKIEFKRSASSNDLSIEDKTVLDDGDKQYKEKLAQTESLEHLVRKKEDLNK